MLMQWHWNPALVKSGSCFMSAERETYGWPKSCSMISATMGTAGEKMGWSNLPGMCRDRSVPDADSCISVGGDWLERAGTESECNAHPKICELKNRNWNAFRAAECSKCDGTMENMFHWSTGRWSPTSFNPMYWKTKEYRSRYQWTNFPCPLSPLSSP